MGEVKRYGVKVAKRVADPYERVEYLYDAEGMKPARMDFESGTFDYGDWGDIWFVKNNFACMVTSAGEIDYKLDPNDYTCRENGLPSEVASVCYDGNAMAAIPLVWLKAWEDDDYQYFSVSPERYDESYHAHAHAREDGSIADFMFLPLFEGALVDGRLRSLACLEPSHHTTGDEEIAAAAANGDNWSIQTWSRTFLLAVLALVISKNDDCQAAFGAGHVLFGDGSQRPSPLFMTGKAMRTGQFFGSREGDVAVKVFHVEHPWGDRFERTLGLACLNGELYVKMEPPYSLIDFSGYTATGVHITGPSRECVRGSVAGEFGRLPSLLEEGCEESFQTDRVVYDPAVAAGIALIGGTVNEGAGGGIWMLNVGYPGSRAHWHQSSSLTCVSK